MTDQPSFLSESGGGPGSDGASGTGGGGANAIDDASAPGAASRPAAERADVREPVPPTTAEATPATQAQASAGAPPETLTAAAAVTGTLLDEVASVLAPDEAIALRSRLGRDGIGPNDPRIVRLLPDLIRRSKRTVLSEIIEALGADKGERVREVVERLGLDENDPRLVGYALNQDLESTLERLPDETAAAAASFSKTLDTSTTRIESAFDTGIERVENAAAQYGAKELVTFDVAFAKVASDRLERLVKEVVKAVQSPWNRWATVAIVIVGLALAWTAGWWTGRAQFADRYRVYEAHYAKMTPEIRRFVDGFWR